MKEKNEKLKRAIATQLANFLLSEKRLPEEITIAVEYKESSSMLHLDAEKIRAEIGSGETSR